MSAIRDALVRIQSDKQGEATTDRVHIPTIHERRSEELVLAMVGPVGSGCSRVAQILRELLEHEFGYSSSIHKLSDAIEHSLPLLGDAAPAIGSGIKRVEDLQSAGNALRKRFGHEYLAAKTIERIARWRASHAMEKSAGDEDVPRSVRHVHLIDSLKNPAELRIFRETYGDMFWLFGVFAPEGVRRLRLTNQKGYNDADLALVMRNDYSEREPRPMPKRQARRACHARSVRRL